jgi:MFS family permease
MSNSEQVDNKNATETAAFLEIPPAQKQNAQTEPPELEKQESVKKLPPDGGYGWVVLVASFSISFILDAIMYSFGILLTAIKEHYEVSNKTANLLTSLYTGCFLLCGPLVSGLIKQFGCRVTIICGAAVTSLMFFVSIFAPNIYVMYITIGVIGGSATGVFYISALLIIPEYFDKHLGIATGVTMAGSGIGFFIGPPIISKLISNFGWKVTLSTCAALLLCNSFIGIFSKPLNPPKTKISFKKKKKPAVVESINVDVMSGSIVSLKHKSTDDEDESIIVGLFKEMINFKLLGSNWRFLFMTLSNLCIFIGYFLPFIFVTKIAESNNIENPSLVISVIGKQLSLLIAHKKNTFTHKTCTQF